MHRNGFHTNIRIAKFDLALHRDQRRLAVTKLASLPEGNPLREKYEEWIRQLDERIAGTGSAPTEMEVVTFAVADSSTMERAHSSTSGEDTVGKGGATDIQGKQIGLSRPGPPKVLGTADARSHGEANATPSQAGGQKAAYRETLISENELLRGMLLRFA